METFPSYATLVNDGYSLQREQNILRTQMETGPAKQLKTKSRSLVTVNCAVQLSSANYTLFLAWFQNNLDYGADWFYWTDPRTVTVKTARIIGGLEAESPLSSRLGIWKVRFKLEYWSA